MAGARRIARRGRHPRRGRAAGTAARSHLRTGAVPRARAMSSVKLEVVDDPAQACAERLVEAARRGAHIGLTGGSTPREAYRIAAEAQDAWGGVTVWFSDDRCVLPEDDRSN